MLCSPPRPDSLWDQLVVSLYECDSLHGLSLVWFGSCWAVVLSFHVIVVAVFCVAVVAAVVMVVSRRADND